MSKLTTNNYLHSVTLYPAYGRKYNDKQNVLTDFNNGKDFIFKNHRGQTYMNIYDVKQIGLKQVIFRYNQNASFILTINY